MKKKSAKSKLLLALLAGVALPTMVGAQNPEDHRAILQYFEGKWETMERRMPDIFMAGYGALWLPPAARADSGNQSVGFDVFDRFDLGREFNPTLYGTESGLLNMIAMSKRAGLLVYFDTVYNHNGFTDGYRDNQTGDVGCAFRWERESGGYPGFIMNGSPFGLSYNLDFRNVCPSAEFPQPNCDSDPLNCRISSLIDIRHESESRWIRHPADPENENNIPYQRVDVNNARFYPDRDLAPLPSAVDNAYPFNAQNPLAGDPTVESVTGMLRRYTQWMLQVNGIAGFRLDAVKHTPASWFNDEYDRAAFNMAYDFWGRPTTAFSFGEFVSSSWDELRPHHRRDGFGNRTVIDFPLKFALQNNIGGNLGNIIGASFDGADDGNAQNGSAGVMFVQSHDNGFIGDPPGLQNMAYAHILSRKGRPIVYMNAQEFRPTLGNRDFPNNTSRGDALGQYGNTITTLVGIYNNFNRARFGNEFAEAWKDDDYVAYELRNTLLVGLCDRFDRGPNNQGYEVRNITVPGFRSIRLKEITGNASNIAVDPTDDIPDFIDVPANGQIAFRVPTNRNKNDLEHGKPYVMYTIEPPQGLPIAVPGGFTDIGLSVENVSSSILPDPDTVDQGYRRLTRIDVVTADTAQIVLRIDPTKSQEDNALFRWNYGMDVDGEAGIHAGIDYPLVAGYEKFTKERSPSFGGGTGVYKVEVDLTNPAIGEGYHYISAVAFLQREASLNLPPIMNTFRKVIYVDRRGPDASVVFPSNPTGTNDITSTSYGFAVENPDGTANSVHYFWNLPEGTNPITENLLNDSNKAQKTDRKRFRFTLNNLQNGANQRLTLVLFEESGNTTVQTFNIGVSLPVDTAPKGFIVY